MKTLPILAALALTGFAYSPILTGQGLFPGAGMSEKEFGNGSGPFSQGRGMDHLIRQIEEAEEPREPTFAMPEWMKPKKPQWPQQTFQPSNSGSNSWLHLPKPSWLNASKKPSYGSTSQNGFLADTGKNFDQWRHKTGNSIRSTNENIRSSTTNAWQNMTRSLQRPSWMNPGSSETPPAIKPPLRSADNWSSRPTDRF